MNGPGSQQRMLVALLLIAAAALGTVLTMDPGRSRTVVLVLLGFFAFRVLIGRMRRQQVERRTEGLM